MGTVKTVALSLLAAVLILLLSWQSFFDQVNSAGYDFILRLAGPVAPSDDILIVGIDEESLDQIGGWPWSRGILAELLVEILAGGPAAVGVDVLLDDETDDDGDNALEAVLSRASRIVLAARVDDVGQETVWRLPLELFRTPGTSLGHVHADPDLDGVLRRVVTAKHAEGTLVSAFSIQVLRAGERLPPGFVEDLGGAVRIEPAEMRIRFAGDRGSFETVPAWRLLEGGVDRAIFEDRIVLVGATAAGLDDDWMTPFSVSGREMSGIEVHANAVDTILSGREVLPVPDLFVLFLIAFVVLGLRMVERRFEGVRFYAAAVASIPVLAGLSWAAMRLGDFWIPFPTLMLGVALVVPALGIRKFVKVNRDLDRQLERMSRRTGGVPAGISAGLRDDARRVEDNAAREKWLAALDAYGRRLADHETERAEAAGRLKDVPDKLDAVEFFNREMARRVSFSDSVLGGIDDAIIVSDPAGAVVYQNPAARRLEQFLETPPPLWEYLDTLVEKAEPARWLDAFARTFVDSDPTVFDAVERRVATRGRDFTVTLSGIADVAVLASLHDVTAERELDRAKNDMVALVSHELRTPLTSIRGFADMLETYGLVEEKGRRFLRSIVSESQRLDTLVQSFLDIAAIESGRQTPAIADVDPAALAEEIALNHRVMAEAKGIAIDTRTSGTGDVRFPADRTLVYQALANLVSNALKYSPPGTRVTLEARTAPEWMEFRVTDQGHGIPASDLERIFEKFYRRSNPETREEAGFGLGLAFVRQVVELHGGRAEVTSEEGRGSSFVVRIPRERG